MLFSIQLQYDFILTHVAINAFNKSLNKTTVILILVEVADFFIRKLLS